MRRDRVRWIELILRETERTMDELQEKCSAERKESFVVIFAMNFLLHNLCFLFVSSTKITIGWRKTNSISSVAKKETT